MRERDEEWYQTGGGEENRWQECIPVKAQFLWIENTASHAVTHYVSVGTRDQGSHQECCVARRREAGGLGGDDGECKEGGKIDTGDQENLGNLNI